MDKETLSNYGWIVICTLVLAVMIALATPFGEYIKDGVWSATNGLNDTLNKNMEIAINGDSDNKVVEPIYSVNLEDFYSKDNNVSFTYVDNGFKILNTVKTGYDIYSCLDIFVPANSHCSISFDLIEEYSPSDMLIVGYISPVQFDKTNSVKNISEFCCFGLNTTINEPISYSFDFPVSDTDTTYYLTVFFEYKSGYKPCAYLIIDNFNFNCSFKE